MNSKDKLITYWQYFVLPWFMWGCGALFYFYEFLVQVSPNVMAAELMRDFNFTGNRLGVLSSIYFWAYALMQIPAGILLDKLGPHRLLAVASATLAVGCLLFADAHNFSIALIARFLIGLGSSFAVIGCMKLATNWFPPNRFALLLGLTITVGMTGAIFGERPLRQFIEWYDWRTCMNALSILGALLFLIFFFFVKDQPSSRHSVSHSNQTFKHVIKGLFLVIQSKQMWIVALYGCLMFAPTITFCGLWGGQFIALKCHISLTEATAVISAVFIGWVIGSPLGGGISDKLGLRLPTMIVGALGACISFAMILYIPDLSKFQATSLLFIFGLLSSGFLTSFSIVRESSPAQCVASALGFMNMMNTLGIALAQPLIGLVLDYMWSGQKDAEGVPIYTLLDFQQALAVLPVILAIAFLLTPFIHETYCRPLNKHNSNHYDS